VTATDALARHRLARARTALDESDVLLGQGHVSGALNRVYYAAFYAARAVLATVNLDSSRHSGVISLFQQHFVKTGLVQTDIAKALPRAFEKRQTADHGDFSEPTREEVLSLRDQVEAFVLACQRVVDSNSPA
jgi:uncharacterized protein (UPF0332 family)